jgi:CCR4-NOT transcription complex subunit 6
VIDDTPVPQSEVLSLLTYNTLCQHYCTPKLYGYSPSAALSWEHRQEVILGEIRARDADFLCLQEVEHDAFENIFRANLAHNDYKGVFWPKGRAKTMSPNDAKAVDGCATFYKNSKYILLDKQLVDIPSAAINRPDMKGESDIYNRVMPKDNVAVVTFFENRMTGARIIIVNVHLHWDHVYKDVKVVQVAVLLEQIAKFAETYASWPPLKEKEKQLYRYTNGDKLDGEDSEDEAPLPKPSMTYSDPLSIPFILCGDFNSLPDSGPYELITRGTLPPDHPDLAGRKYGNFTRDGMHHPFSLKSAFGHINELPFTNYTSNFTGVVDYIYYATGSLGVRGLLGEVDEEYLARVPGFPNVHFPSDHLALFAEFQLKSRRGTTKVNHGKDHHRDGKS